MRSKLHILFAAILIILPFAQASTNVTDCSDLNIAGETYILNQSISTATDPCLTISEANITLDCNGFEISSSVSIALQINDVENATIKNCLITGATTASIEYADFGNSSQFLTFDNITSSGSTAYGILLNKGDIGGIVNYTRIINSNIQSLVFIDMENSGFSYGDIINSTITGTASSSGAIEHSGMNSIKEWYVTDSYIDAGVSDAAIAYQRTHPLNSFLKFINSEIVGKINHLVASGSSNSVTYLLNTTYSGWDDEIGTMGGQSYGYVYDYVIANVTNSTGGVPDKTFIVYDANGVELIEGNTSATGLVTLEALRFYLYSGNYKDSAGIDITPDPEFFDNLIVTNQTVVLIVNSSLNLTGNLTSKNSTTEIFNFKIADNPTVPTPTPTPAPTTGASSSDGTTLSKCGDGLCDLAIENDLTCPKDCPKPTIQVISGSMTVEKKYDFIQIGISLLFALIIAFIMLYLYNKKYPEKKITFPIKKNKYDAKRRFA